MQPIHIIGGGLAGCEAAWQIVLRGIPVVIHEMRPGRMSEAHKTAHLAELVCSNSFRSDDAQTNAVGLLHEEMRRLGSLILRAGDTNQVPAGGALAVDRDGFAAAVTAAITSHPLIDIRREEISAPSPDWESVIIATGPLTSPTLAGAVRERSGADALAFFDAIAPIVERSSIDMSVAWFQSRYDKEGPGGTGADYINCPLTRDQYDAFVDALLAGEKTQFHEWEAAPYFDGCLPIEVMAERGRETLRHGPMKPVGLTDPHKPEKPYAVVQLRQDNQLGTLFNIVGFQTKLKHGEQLRIFREIPGLANAQFARLGGVHRNTFLNSPKLLDATLRLKSEPRLRFAGQITGCEGYVEFGGHRPARRVICRRRTTRRSHVVAAPDHRAWRLAQPHHGWPYRNDRRRTALVPTDEYQLRSVSTADPQPVPRERWYASARCRQDPGQEARPLGPRARRSARLVEHRAVRTEQQPAANGQPE